MFQPPISSAALEPRISVIIPAHNEERFIGRCLESIRRAAAAYSGEVETIVVLNRCTDRTEDLARKCGARVMTVEEKNLSKIRNAGARVASGEILVTIDADSWMTPNMLREIARKLSTGRTIGGGVLMWPERLSLGMIVSFLFFIPYLLVYRVSGGLFWCRREDFEALGGFNESLVSVEDLDFAIRLKALGRRKGKPFSTILTASITTSCRKFDWFGDWHLLKNPRLVRRIFSGRDQDAANRYYYDVERR